MPCKYCGLATDGGDSHASTERCLDALAAEKARLGKALRPSTSEESNRRTGTHDADDRSQFARERRRWR